MKNPWYLPFNSKPDKLFCCRVTIADNSKRQIPTHLLVVHSMDLQPLTLDLSKALVLLLHSTHLRRCALVLSKDWVELDDVSLDHRLSPLS